MSNNLKDLTEAASKFVNTSLDNLQQFIDRTADEVAKADVVGANRRIADQMIDFSRNLRTVGSLIDDQSAWLLA